jgi:peptide/nickel transport system permease protein
MPWSARIGIFLFVFFIALAVTGGFLAPYDPQTIHYLPDGQVARLLSPSSAHWLGTTYYGRDVLSQLMVGARVPVVVGLLAAVFITTIGTNIGLVAGYYGGRLGAVLMRITDLAFGIPFLPFAVVLVALLKPSLVNMIITIVCLMWRTTARVIRAQVLSLKERPFIKAAKVAGASNLRIIYVHLLPNVLPMSMLYVTFGIAWAVTAEASLSFLGFGDPQSTSWGQMLYEAFTSGSIRQAHWWTLPPGLCISMFVISAFLIGRYLERFAHPKLASES